MWRSWQPLIFYHGRDDLVYLLLGAGSEGVDLTETGEPRINIDSHCRSASL